MLGAHLRRMGPSLRMIFDEQDDETCDLMLQNSLNRAKERFLVGRNKEEVLATILCDVQGRIAKLHACAAPPLTFEFDCVLISKMKTAEGNRELNEPWKKNFSWIRDRAKIEQVEKEPSVNEVLLLDANNEAVLEGLTTNVFVVYDNGQLRTAPSGILPGTSRELIFRVCRENGISLCLSAPLLKERSRWVSMLVSSCNRPGCIVHRIRIRNEDSEEELVMKPDEPICKKIQHEMLKHFV